MIKNLILLFVLFFGLTSAQVGINTSSPNATLDVTGFPADATKLDGIIAPRLSLAQLNAKTYGAAQTGALVYVNDATGTTNTATALIKGVGYYSFDGTIWQNISLKIAIFTASLGNGAGNQINATIAASGFNTVPLSTVSKNVGGGVWSGATTYTYTVPLSGTYIIKSSIRLTDGSVSRNIFQSVGTSNADVPEGIWQTNPAPTGTGRWTMLYTRIAFFNKGDLLRLYIYSDGAVANLSDASLNIALLNQN